MGVGGFMPFAGEPGYFPLAVEQIVAAIRQMTALAIKFGQILEESISLQTNTDVTKEGNHNE